MFPVQLNSVHGLRRARAQGLLLEPGGPSSFDTVFKSSHDSEPPCSGSGSDREFAGWFSRVNVSLVGLVFGTARTRYSVKNGYGSFTGGYWCVDVEVDDMVAIAQRIGAPLTSNHSEASLIGSKSLEA